MVINVSPDFENIWPDVGSRRLPAASAGASRFAYQPLRANAVGWPTRLAIKKYPD
jgi:hypothetical protein